MPDGSARSLQCQAAVQVSKMGFLFKELQHAHRSSMWNVRRSSDCGCCHVFVWAATACGLVNGEWMGVMTSGEACLGPQAAGQGVPQCVTAVAHRC